MCGRMICVKPVKCGNVRKQLNGLWVMNYGLRIMEGVFNTASTKHDNLYTINQLRPVRVSQDPYQINAAEDICKHLKMLQECFFGEKPST